MSLDLQSLRKVKPVGTGYRAQCPACAEAGLDRSGQHLRIFPDGRWGCAVQPADVDHRKRIWELAHGAPTKPTMPWRPMPPTKSPDWNRLLVRWESQTDESRLVDFAGKLGVSVDSLHALGCAWAQEHKAFAFPMWDGNGKVIGVRLRDDKGAKWSVSGSKNGLFVPMGLEPQKPAWLVEGPTDAAAGLSLGLHAIGRPAATGGEDHLRRLLGHQRAVILADNDPPGLAGARKLAIELRSPTAILVLPAKDLREFMLAGGTRAMLEAMLRSVIWRRP